MASKSNAFCTAPGLTANPMQTINLKRFDVHPPTKSELAGIRKGRADFKRGDVVTLNQLQNELESARHESKKQNAEVLPNPSSALVAPVQTKEHLNLKTPNPARKIL